MLLFLLVKILIWVQWCSHHDVIG